MYKVSVIIPTFNCAQFLPDCLDSLLKQTVSNFEIILIDDASTDNTYSIIQYYKNIFGKRLIYKRLDNNVGRGEVRNYGLKTSNGEYITFLDADDVYLPQKIETQENYLDEHTEAVGVTCRHYYVSSDLKSKWLINAPTYPFSILFGEQYNKFEESTVALMARRSVLQQKVGYFDKRLERCEDTDLVIRLIKVGQVHYIDTPLYLYRQHENNAPSINAIRQQTKSNCILFKKIINSECGSRVKMAQKFAQAKLANHIFRLRELKYLDPILVWVRYSFIFFKDLNWYHWFSVAIKTVIGYRITKLFKCFLKKH